MTESMKELKWKINDIIKDIDEDSSHIELIQNLFNLFNKEKMEWLKSVAPKQNELNYDLSSPFDTHWHNGSCAYEKQLFANAEKSLK